MSAYIAIAVCLVALGGLVLGEKLESPTMKWICKPLASAAFVALALARGGLDSARGTVIVVGLVLGLAGDVLLIPKSKRAFMAGIGAFLLGHVAYTISFFMPPGAVWACGLAALAVVPASFFVARWLLPSVQNSLRGPVVAYVLVISVMLIGAAGAGVAHPILFGAAVLFYLSDLSVALDRFKDAGFWNRAWGLPAYFIAQLLFAWSVTLP